MPHHEGRGVPLVYGLRIGREEAIGVQAPGIRESQGARQPMVPRHTIVRSQGPDVLPDRREVPVGGTGQLV